MNHNTHEYECLQCGGSFIETLGQRLEEFISPSNSSTEASPAEGRQQSVSLDQMTASDGNVNIIERLLGGILGVGIQAAPTNGDTNLFAVLQQTALQSGHPVGLMVRHGPFRQDQAGIVATILGGSTGTTLGSLGQPLLGRSMEDILHHIMMNETSHAGSPPASETAIQALRRQTVCHSTDDPRFGVCCISQEPFEDGDVVILMPCCNHAYKEVAILQWLRQHNTCPVCRQQLEAPDSNCDT